MSLAARSVVVVVIVGLAAVALVVAVIGLSWAARSDELAAASEGTTARPSAPARPLATTQAPTPRPTAQVLASGDVTAVYAAFLDRVQSDRGAVEALQRALLTGIDDHDQAAIRDAALAMRAFVDQEQTWLDGNPPAACFADTHTAARGMLASLGTAADRFVEWAAAGGELNVGGAFGVALDAGSRATEAFDAFVVQLKEATCPA